MAHAPSLTEEWEHLSSQAPTPPEKPKTPIKEGEFRAFETFRKFAQGKTITPTLSASALEIENTRLQERIKFLEDLLRQANTAILTLKRKVPSCD